MTAPSVGIMLPLGSGLPARVLLDAVVAADRAGLDGVACGEHASTELFSLLGAMAARTSAIRLEAAVVSTLARSPALIAMGAATVADLSGGRFALALGAGSPMLAGWHGRPFDGPVERMATHLTQVRAALAGERLGAAGSFRLQAPPGHPVPLVVAASSPRMAALAAAEADGLLLNLAGPAQVATLAAKARAGAGDRPFEVVVVQWAFTGHDRAAARATFARDFGPYLAVPTYARGAAAIVGHDAVARATAAWREGGRTAVAEVVPDELVDALLVVGDAAELAERVSALGRSGADAVRFLPVVTDPGDRRPLDALVAELARR